MDFANFSAQAFERLVQALSTAVLGPGISVFGSGPDGGREATISGRVPYPSAAENWDGYIVVQAKCREKPRHSADDANWLVAQLKEELDAFAKPRSGRQTPEYYILATNVTLSPKLKTGGKAKIESTRES